jgi:PAS domain S-box-containing protein
MRDEHRPKQDLIHEVTGLRKQVLDLKDAMVARRRVEDALRATEAMLRSLMDGAPVGLCLFRRDGTLLTTNGPFARMLGYDSPAELQRIGGVLGVFACRDEEGRVLGSTGNGHDRIRGAVFRTKDGAHRSLRVMASGCPEHDSVVLAVFEGNLPFPPRVA